MKKIIVILCILPTIIVYGQNKTKKNPFQMVDVPDSIRYELALFDKREEQTDDIYLNINIYNLINRKDYKFHDGIYYFRLMCPHIFGRIFIYYKNKMTIFKSNYIEDLLEEYLQFLKENELPELTRIEYLAVISKFLKDRYIERH